MIYIGSALMVLNIIQYYMFTRNMRQVGTLKIHSAIIELPFFLLIFFFVGYLLIAFLGDPSIMMAGVLFGGSIFVSLILTVMFRIIKRLSSSEQRTRTMYDELRDELTTLTQDSLATFRVNLTTDTIEDRAGMDLYESDNTAQTYTELMQNRYSDLIIKPSSDNELGLFTREGLIEHYQNGHNSAQEIVYARRKNVKNGYYLVEASLIQKPSTGDIIAFITEREYNRDVVNEAIWNKALREEYEVIGYIAGEQLGVLLNRSDNEAIRKHISYGEPVEYENVIKDLIEELDLNMERQAVYDALDLSNVEKELSHKDVYTFDYSFNMDDGKVYQSITFYAVDKEAGFYMIMVSDTTNIRREQEEQNRILEEALEASKASNVAKSVFLSNMSHDIRTPMNAIIGFTNLAKQDEDVPDKTREYLDKILTSGNHLLSLINDVLEMSRIESGKIELNNSPCNLADIMEQLQAMVLNQSDDKNQKLVFDISKVTDMNVICDELRLKQVLLNLTSNAVKYTPENGLIEIRAIQSGARKDGKATYEFHVKDNGIGMTSEFAAHVFEAFEREKTTTISGIQGTGLGMAITKNIIELMEGSIDVITAPDKGTEFVVRLELEISESCDESEGEVQEALDVDFTGKRLLLVDDMDINREIAKAMLEANGFIIDEATNGQEALDMVADSEPDYYYAVLMDIQMPVMDGYEATKAIRKLENSKLANIPIIAMTANAFDEDRKNAIAYGMNAHVAKPIDVDQLLGTLSSLLPALDKG